jgi:hypothetical protein
MKKFSLHLEQGQAMMIATVFFLVVSLTVIYGLVGPVLRQEQTVANLFNSRGGYYVAEAGVEDALYRLESGKSVGASYTLALNGGTTTVTLTNTTTGKDILSSGSVVSDVRKVQTSVEFGTGISFHYGIQSGRGGFTLQNSSSITGNVYSGGTVSGGGNMIYGDVVSSGAAGQIYGVHATGSAYAHFLGKSGASATTIDRNGYYQTKVNATVSGTSFPGSADLGDVDLPISDAQISSWESDALAGGTMLSSECDTFSSNTCTITSNKTLGPKKIPFNLTIKGATITIAGQIWVTGNITVLTQSAIKMDPNLGSTNVAVIADDASNRLTGSIISVNQGATFQNSGTVGSFVFLISMNNSAENGGSVQAVQLNQGASALVAYATHGLINLSQSVSVKEVTAYQITLSQSANVTYDTGLPSVLFEAGPSGGYSITSWKEVQ